MYSQYTRVETWMDLCKTNVEFLEGKHEETFYHYGPIDPETSQDSNFLKSLIELNNLGLFTVCSQPFLNQGKIIDCKDMKELEDYYPLTHKISFIDFYCQQEIAYKLLPLLLSDNTIYFSFQSINKYKPAWIDNFPNSRFNFTRLIHGSTNIEEYTNWNKNLLINNNYILEPPECHSSKNIFTNNKISKLIEDSVFICISGRDYETPISIPEKLLELHPFTKKWDTFIDIFKYAYFYIKIIKI